MAVDMTQVIMLDDIDLSVEEKFAADPSVFAVAGYVNGATANWPAVVKKYEATGKFLLSIDVQGNPLAGAQCLDIENRDATIGQAPVWFKVTQASGRANRDLRWFPKLYCSAGSGASLIATMSAAGIPRGEYLYWSAHYTGKPHICAPDVCGFPQADATQWTSTAHGVSLDQSLCFKYFFAGPGGEIATHVPAPAPAAPVKLAAPSHLAAEASYRGVTLLWIPVKGAQAYDVQLLGPDGTEAGRVTSIPPKTELPVKASTDYKFRVASMPDGDWSEDFAFKTPAPPAPVVPDPPATPPAAPPGTPPAPVEPEPFDYSLQVLSAGNKLGLPAGSIVLTPKED